MLYSYCTLVPINKDIKICDYYDWYQKRENSVLHSFSKFQKNP